MNGELMTRQGLPTGQMEQETQELLDEYNEEYCWEYNDMVDFIKEYGEKNFRDYYETYNRLCEDYGQNLVDEFAENFDVDSVDHFEDIYQGQYDSGADFAKQIATDCGYIKSYQGDLPSWIEIDWKASWDNLSYDYCEQDGYIFSQNF